MLRAFAGEVCSFLMTLPEVRGCRLYGSLAAGTEDAFSDADIEIDVSGADNGQFALRLPELLSAKYAPVFCDYAPSLAPEKYVLSAAVDSAHPFRILDLCCAAQPHISTVTREMLLARNNAYDHTLKLFTINLKHFLRGGDCARDVRKMHRRIFGDSEKSVREMLDETFLYLRSAAGPQHCVYLDALETHMK